MGLERVDAGLRARGRARPVSKASATTSRPEALAASSTFCHSRGVSSAASSSCRSGCRRTTSSLARNIGKAIASAPAWKAASISRSADVHLALVRGAHVGDHEARLALAELPAAEPSVAALHAASTLPRPALRLRPGTLPARARPARRTRGAPSGCGCRRPA